MLSILYVNVSDVSRILSRGQSTLPSLLLVFCFFPFLPFFKPPPPVGAGGGYMFSGCPSVPPSVRDSRGSFMFPRYLQYLLTDFRQAFVTGASWDTDYLITFLGRKVKGQGHTIAVEAHSTRRYRRTFLVCSVFRFHKFLVLMH